MRSPFADIPARGRWALLGCTVCQMGLGCAYVYSPLLKSIVAELGWSRAGFSVRRAPLILAMSLAFPVVGALADRFGARRVLSGCTLLLGAAFVLMGQMQQPWEFVAINALLGVALAGLGDIVVGAVAARWVAARRGLALGLVYVGSNLGGTAVPLIAAGVLGSESWRLALAAVGIGAVALILPFAAFAVREPPPGWQAAPPAERADGRDADDLDLAQALRTRSFWILAFVLFAFYLYYVATIEHLVPFLSDVGYSDGRAAASLSFAVFLGIGAKLASGALADRIPKKRAALLNFGLLVLASVLLLGARQPALLVAFLVAQGFAVAAENVLLPLLVADCFGARHLARIYGALMLTLLAGVLGPVLAGASFDLFARYEPAFGAFAALNALALLALARVRDERVAARSAERAAA